MYESSFFFFFFVKSNARQLRCRLSHVNEGRFIYGLMSKVNAEALRVKNQISCSKKPSRKFKKKTNKPTSTRVQLVKARKEKQRRAGAKLRLDDPDARERWAKKKTRKSDKGYFHPTVQDRIQTRSQAV